MAITTKSDLNSLFANIYEEALFVAREMNIMTNLVRNFSASGWMDRSVSRRAQVTAVDVTEGVDFANPTTFGRTSLATLTPGEVMAQVTLTDIDLETDPDNAREDASRELGGAVATKIDVDLVGEFADFTTDKGSAGSALTVAICAAGVSVLRNSSIPNPLYFVLHPYGWHDIWTELGQPSANQAFLGEIANQALQDFYAGRWLNADWFVNANISVDASDDAVSGVFSPQAIGFDSRKMPTMEPDRDASLRAWELNMVAGYAHEAIRTDYGIGLTHDATEPT